MKGSVTKLCDMSSIAIPAEMLVLHVDEQQVEADIRALGLHYAKEETAKTVQQGDMVACRGDAASCSDGRTVLIYPGLSIPGAEAAEQAALGKQPGDTFSAEQAGKTATLTVDHGRTPVEVNDALVAGIGLENVTPVEDYRRCLRQRKLEKKKGRDVFGKMYLADFLTWLLVACYQLASGLFSIMFIVIIFVIGGQMVPTGEVTIGDLTSFYLITGIVGLQLMQLFMNVGSVSGTFGTMKKIAEISDMDPEQTQGADVPAEGRSIM